MRELLQEARTRSPRESVRRMSPKLTGRVCLPGPKECLGLFNKCPLARAPAEEARGLLGADLLVVEEAVGDGAVERARFLERRREGPAARAGGAARGLGAGEHAVARVVDGVEDLAVKPGLGRAQVELGEVVLVHERPALRAAAGDAHGALLRRALEPEGRQAALAAEDAARADDERAPRARVGAQDEGLGLLAREEEGGGREALALVDAAAAGVAVDPDAAGVDRDARGGTEELLHGRAVELA